MNTSDFTGNSLMRYDPSLHQREVEHDMLVQAGHDREKPPRPEPGDKYIIICAVLGVILGGILGFLFFGFFGSFGGLLAGGIAGALIGALIGKRARPRSQYSK